MNMGNFMNIIIGLFLVSMLWHNNARTMYYTSISGNIIACISNNDNAPKSKRDSVDVYRKKHGNIIKLDTTDLAELGIIKNIVIAPNDSYLAILKKHTFFIFNIEEQRIEMLYSDRYNKIKLFTFSKNGIYIGFVTENQTKISTLHTAYDHQYTIQRPIKDKTELENLFPDS